jgi:hypothetical protein
MVNLPRLTPKIQIDLVEWSLCCITSFCIPSFRNVFSQLIFVVKNLFFVSYRFDRFYVTFILTSGSIKPHPIDLTIQLQVRDCRNFTKHDYYPNPQVSFAGNRSGRQKTAQGRPEGSLFSSEFIFSDFSVRWCEITNLLVTLDPGRGSEGQRTFVKPKWNGRASHQRPETRLQRPELRSQLCHREGVARRGGPPGLKLIMIRSRER